MDNKTKSVEEKKCDLVDKGLTIMSGAMVFIAVGVGYAMGKRITMLSIDYGLNLMFKKDPAFEQHFWKVLKETKNK